MIWTSVFIKLDIRHISSGPTRRWKTLKENQRAHWLAGSTLFWNRSCAIDSSILSQIHGTKAVWKYSQLLIFFDDFFLLTRWTTNDIDKNSESNWIESDRALAICQHYSRKLSFSEVTNARGLGSKHNTDNRTWYEISFRQW